MKTLYISDLDGTLLNQNAELSKYTSETLNELIRNGLSFSFATARTAASTTKIMDGIHLKFPVILMNGVLIYDMLEKKYIKIETLRTSNINYIIKTLQDFNITGFAYAIRNEKLLTYYENLNAKPLLDFYEERCRKYYKSFEKVESFSKIADSGIIYFTMLDTAERLKLIHQLLLQETELSLSFYKDIYSNDLWYLEIYSIKASKYHAVQFIREYLKLERIVGFGDNLNDLPLFKACDEKYAVANAAVELKNIADGIIESNINDGVIKYLNALPR